MMTTDLIRTLYDYNYWANELIWNSIEKLNDGDFEKNTEYSWGSIKTQLVQTMNTEWMWFYRLRGETPKNVLRPEDFPSHDSIKQKWREVEAQVRGYLNTLNDDELKAKFEYTTASGKSHTQSIGEILLHVIISSTDHRAQTIAMLHILGIEPVEQGLIYYLRERQEFE
jgi:uncharacterized damage-inducible protein DinB